MIISVHLVIVSGSAFGTKTSVTRQADQNRKLLRTSQEMVSSLIT